MSNDPQQAEVIIVGGGVGGIYCAWRLLKKNPLTKIILFEQSNRLGGRLDTDIVKINNHEVKEEEGGMRFLSTQTTLQALITKLGLGGEVIPFSMGDENNRFYLRGRSFTVKDVTESKNKIWSEIYNLNDNEKNKTSAEILLEVIYGILKQNNLPCGNPKDIPQTPDEWKNFRLNLEYNSQKIYKWGFWPLLTEYGLSQECITMLIDTQGFVGPYVQLVNAGIALQLFEDFPKDAKFSAFQEGYSTLPDKLVSEIFDIETKNQPGWNVIRKECQVDSFEQKDGKYHVTIHNNPQTFSCDKIILAIPKFALEKLYPTSPPLNSNKNFLPAILGVTSMYLSKINLYYDTRWWFTDPNLKLSAGGSFTDLPIDQLYCFEPMADNDYTGPAALTLYCSDFRGNYWDELQSLGERYNTKLQEKYLEMVPVSIAVEGQATAQLKIMLGKEDIPHPVLTSFKRWAVDASGSAYHQWRIGANDEELTAVIWKPHDNVYVCGEAFSDTQAWVEGALRTSERVLIDGFGLDPII